MNPNNKKFVRAGALACLVTLCGVASAGRPLVVDDANVNEAGHGQLEAWAARAPGSTSYNLAPAYAPIDGLEIGALLARDTKADLTLSALQAKWRITPSQEDGCNAGAVLGIAHARGAPNTAYLNGLFTCNKPAWGSVHLNVGVSKPRGEREALGWGVAYEREIGGVTPHVEWFGSDGAKPTFQVGLRGNITQRIQLDGSVGRSNGATLYTLGTKFQF